MLALLAERLRARKPDLAKQAIDYWMGQGLTKDQALGVVGNQRGENALGSSRSVMVGKLPVSFNGTQIGERLILAGTGIDVSTADFLDQQKAARWEMEHSPDAANRVWDRLKASKNAAEAVSVMVDGYERPADRMGEKSIRLGHPEALSRYEQRADPPAAQHLSPPLRLRRLRQPQTFISRTHTPVVIPANTRRRRSIPTGNRQPTRKSTRPRYQRTHTRLPGCHISTRIGSTTRSRCPTPRLQRFRRLSIRSTRT